jgi:beta-lactamase superfamily II metal-dependent hydrolase
MAKTTRKSAQPKSRRSSKRTIIPSAPSTPTPVDGVSIRMYCIGTGDCFLLKFLSGKKEVFTMMIDCGSCRGDKKDFTPYIQDLAGSLTNKTIDLLVVTHEHNDHVNGFDKCYDIFKGLTIKEAWFAWTEDPADPTGAAAGLKQQQQKMKMGLQNAMTALESRRQSFLADKTHNAYRVPLEENHAAFLMGLDTLASINLPGDDKPSLPGMRKIKQLLEEKKVKTRYLTPGDTFSLSQLPGLTFYVLGPPTSRDAISKDGKQGTDVYNKSLALNNSNLSVNAFLGLTGEHSRNDLPFSGVYVDEPPADKVGEAAMPGGTDKAALANAPAQAETAAAPVGKSSANIINAYYDAGNDWRKIDGDWLNSAGALALRLNSHINNTSLVLAIEFTASDKVLLFPGDAEFGSWESWHLIDEWMTKGKGNKPWAEDLLGRTIFYKVGHHLSYNGTALEKGILMMKDPAIAAMATLDRHRIAKGWTSTMPNKPLLQELIRRTQGKLFIMDEFEIAGPPSVKLDPLTLGADVYSTFTDKGKLLYKQYTIKNL